MKNQELHARLGRLPLAAVTLIASTMGLAHADTLQDLKSQIDNLQREVTDLKKQQGSSAPNKGGLKLAGSGTSLTIGGYAKLDALYSSRSGGTNSAADQLFDPTSIPVGPGAGANERNQITLHARQSRLFLKTNTPSEWGDVNTHLEFDLFGASGNESVSNSHNLRVRHAYGSIGPLLSGQTWSNFMAVSALPEAVDFGGPAGQTFVRQAQVRWTQPFAGGQWSVALENPETVVTRPDGTAFRADDDRAPDLTGNLGFKTAFGDYTLTALVRQIRIDSSNPAAVDSKVGGAIGVYGVIPTVGKDTFNFGLNAGNGVGRYWGGLLTDGFVDAAGNLDLPDQIGGFVSYRHFWTNKLRSTLALGTVNVDNPAFVVGTVNKRFESVHLNLMWNPAPNTTLGAEYIFGRRETENGLSGNVNRLQTMVQFAF